MKLFHLRFTPCDLSGYNFDWLERYHKFIVAQEDLEDDGTPLLHYHILIETDNAKDSIRDMAKNRLRIPSGNGRGKNNKYYALIEDWYDISYICKYNQILCSQGYSEKELLEFVESGKKKHLNKVVETPAENSVTVGSKTSSPKSPRIPYQQQIIAIASAEWYKYKRQCNEQGFEIDKTQVIEFVCNAMREVSRGINQYLLQDIVNAVLFDDPDYRERTLQRLKSKIQV